MDGRRFDTKMYLVTYTDEDTGERYVSHGIGDISELNYVTPNDPLPKFKPKWDDYGPYVEVGE